MNANELLVALTVSLVNDIAKQCMWANLNSCDHTDCACTRQAKRQVDLILKEAEQHGWKLMPREATEEMAQAAQLATNFRLNIPGTQLTVNLEKAKIRWAAMFDTV